MAALLLSLSLTSSVSTSETRDQYRSLQSLRLGVSLPLCTYLSCVDQTYSLNHQRDVMQCALVIVCLYKHCFDGYIRDEPRFDSCPS